ncbi:2Fe-2S iron-sulfur cluster binding domain-containing protein [Aeromonas simiae]|uniref:2Fe-2S iron-sulfur cluster binding domain-containing protein n=1 Tax=Aeromonas simiae TaxID=218936 RepID=UPI0005A88692|nr:2Fe-2S iron-sulfur cluster binding domain-containing protein [Aeromonas simiae]MDO2947484.1 2Fe-2S iron-sulfur cluster binding domain-containing protein [Aeromonas simiae]MDO2951576.1 2Fe-2S iron-sulfur cluster binding domain-containing protein [Aeromonas simiae]MDO2955044.1 2Fe-2S iron-sulfur cluster binding domain-containing protein [Aeromonas simiae]
MGGYIVKIRGLEGSEARFVVRQGESLLAGAERGGVSPIPVGCCRGGCGLCRIRVVNGCFWRGHMSRRHVSAEQAGAGYALACQVIPESDMEIELAGVVAMNPLRQYCVNQE